MKDEVSAGGIVYKKIPSTSFDKAPFDSAQGKQDKSLRARTQNYNSELKNSLEIRNSSLEIIPRYLHAFTLGELIHIVKEAGFKIIETKKTKWNYLVIAKQSA